MQQDRTDYADNAAPYGQDGQEGDTPGTNDAGFAAGTGDADDLSGMNDAGDLNDAGDTGLTATPPGTAPASLEQCRLPVQCRLGELSLSLAELAALAPGAVLGPLDSVEAPVTLWLGATRIGSGALVDVDGRVGVRITAIIPAPHRG